MDQCELCHRWDTLISYITTDLLKCCDPVIPTGTALEVCTKCMDMINLYLSYLYEI